MDKVVRLTGAKEPRIVLFDLETLPNLPEAMKVWTQLGNYPGLTLKAQISSVICFGFKEFGTDDKPSCINAWDFKRWRTNVNDDRDVIEAGYKILKDADAVVTHNGRRFDWKFFQTRLLIHGMPPLPRIPHIDTCAIAKANLYLFNNKLDTLGEQLVHEKKLENGGWPLWVKVSERDPDALKLMTDYCIQDVALLEKVFKVLRPFAANIPNYNLWTIGQKPVCPNCGGTRLKNQGYRTTRTRTYRRYRCLNCQTYCNTDGADRNPR